MFGVSWSRNITVFYPVQRLMNKQNKEINKQKKKFVPFSPRENNNCIFQHINNERITYDTMRPESQMYEMTPITFWRIESMSPQLL